MSDVVSALGGARGSKPALCHDGNEVTYARLNRAVGRAALELERRRESWVHIGGGSKIDFVIDYLAAAVTRTPMVIGGENSSSWLGRRMQEMLRASAAIGVEAPEVIFSSGTASAPHGVLVDGAEMFEKALVINDFVGNSPEDVEVLALPLSHSFGLGRLRCALVNGQTLAFGEHDRNIAGVLTLGRAFPQIGFGVVGSTAKVILASSRRSLQQAAGRISYVEVGSEAFEPAYRAALREILPASRLVLHYGMTEISRAAMVRLDDPASAVGTVGVPMVGVEAELAEAVSERVDAQHQREILLRGHAMARGTLSAAEGFTPATAWIRTGDHGRIDRHGRLFVDGRLSSVFKVMGRNVAPEITEQEMGRLVPGLRCACVPGEILPGVPILVALVEGRENLGASDVLISDLRDRLPEHQVPRRVVFTTRIPLLANGKIDRRACTRLALHPK